jgi:hypothetical protein
MRQAMSVEETNDMSSADLPLVSRWPAVRSIGRGDELQAGDEPAGVDN